MFSLTVQTEATQACVIREPDFSHSVSLAGSLAALASLSAGGRERGREEKRREELAYRFAFSFRTVKARYHTYAIYMPQDYDKELFCHHL